MHRMYIYYIIQIREIMVHKKQLEKKKKVKRLKRKTLQPTVTSCTHTATLTMRKVTRGGELYEYDAPHKRL